MFTAFVIACGLTITAQLGFCAYVYFCGNPFK